MPEETSADLVIVLSRLSGADYSVEMRFDAPGDNVERPIHRGKVRLTAPLRTQVCSDPARYGSELFKALLVDLGLRTPFAAFRNSAQEKGFKLRVRLLVDRNAPELHDLAWETLCTPPDDEVAPDEHLSTDQNMLFSRFLSSNDWDSIELRPRGDLRALLVVANPSELKGGFRQLDLTFPEVKVEAELARARRALLLDGTGLQENQIVELASREGLPPVRVTIDNLDDLLNEGPGFDILYLVCHGAMLPDDLEEDSPLHPYLLLENDAGSVKRVRGEDLLDRVRVLSSEKSNTRTEPRRRDTYK